MIGDMGIADEDLDDLMDPLPSAVERCRVVPGTSPDLADIDTRGTEAWTGTKDEAKAATARLNDRIQALQEVLYAEGRQRVLIVLQATDTGGKDSTIKRVFDGVNPQGVKVASFKQPSSLEMAHDFLWRVHAKVPGDGEIVIFNRSHYEDVLIVRVHGLVPEERWRRRYDHIADFERMLADEGTTILKFYLHLSKDEQRDRLQERLDDPTKHWKFTTSDLAERERWDDYQAAFTEAMARTSTDAAPWFVIPADRKWYRDLVISQVVVNALEGLDMTYPPAEDGLADVVID
jgi:PPK2 family polyphosphate:nucleotide phosphotransferase